MRFILAFLFAVKPQGLWIYIFQKGGNRMNRNHARHYRKRRGDTVKRLILRKEAQKCAKYPLRAAYGNAVLLKRSRNRGA